MGNYGAFQEEAKRLIGALKNDPILWAQYTKQPIKGVSMFKFLLGSTVKDIITGFEGVITGHVAYITGCQQYLLVPKGGKTERPKAEWFDEDRLKAVKVKIVSLAVKGDGPDMQAPTK